MGLIVNVLRLAFYAIVVWIVLSYVVNFGRLPGDHPVSKVHRALANAIDPVLAPIRRVLPPVRLGGVHLDLSPFILIFGLQILIGILE